MTDPRALKSGTDIRGKAVGDGAQITAGFAYRIGRAFALWNLGRTERPPAVAIGRDPRITGQILEKACAEGIASAGCDAVVFGLCTTPAMYECLGAGEPGAGASVMVTASHHPFDRNGFKFFTKAGGISSRDLDEILALAADDKAPAGPHGSILGRGYLSEYADRLKRLVREKLSSGVALPLLGLHVAVDAGNGAGGFYASVMQELGARIEGSQFLDPDGYFPNHAPNPEDPLAMASLGEAVCRHGADIGVIFDADCDRAAIVDQTGLAINRNRLIALLSAMLLDRESNLTIVTDSVTSSGLSKFIGEWGGEHYRYKRGYRLVIDEAKRLNAAGVNCPLAIETSGHAAFRENGFLDDGMYLSTLLVCECMRLKRDGKLLSSLIDGLREPEESVELRLKILPAAFREAGIRLIEKVMDHASHMKSWHLAPDNREGVRISFDLQKGMDNAWFLLRLSVHDPVLALNVESDVRGGVRRILAELFELLKNAEEADLSPIEEWISRAAP